MQLRARRILKQLRFVRHRRVRVRRGGGALLVSSDKGEQLGVDMILMRGGDAMRRARIIDVLRALDQPRTRVGTSNFLRSLVKSVSENPLMLRKRLVGQLHLCNMPSESVISNSDSHRDILAQFGSRQ